MKQQTFGAMLAELRKEKGMTQLELAQQMGVAVTVLSALGQMESDPALPMLGMGLACLAAAQLPRKEN